MKLLAAAALLGALSFAGPASAHAEGTDWYQISPPANCATMNEATHGLIHDPSDIALLAHLPGAMKMTVIKQRQMGRIFSYLMHFADGRQDVWVAMTPYYDTCIDARAYIDKSRHEMN